MRTKHLLLSSIALFAIERPALAAETTPQHKHAARHAPPVSAHKPAAAQTQTTPKATPRPAASHHSKPADLESRGTESVSVTGRQLTGRDAEQAVTKAIMRQFVPGTALTKCWTGCRV